MAVQLIQTIEALTKLHLKAMGGMKTFTKVQKPQLHHQNLHPENQKQKELHKPLQKQLIVN